MSKKPEKLPLRVIKGGLVPADGYVSQRLRERGYKVGDTLMAILTKPRNPKFNRLAHRIGTLCVKHLPGFGSLTAHSSLKRIQWEANIACEEIGVMMPNIGIVPLRLPESLAFDQMDESVFHEVVKGICRHISFKYWPDLTPAQVEEMADTMVDEA